MLAAPQANRLPVLIHSWPKPDFMLMEQLYEEQMEEQMNVGKYKCMDDLLNSGDTWEV